MTDAARLPPDALIGGKYKVIRLLGEGGMGAVYEAENTWTHRRVAVKVLLPEYASNAEAVERFFREAQSAAQLSHPNIVDVFDMGREGQDGALYIVQELLDGTDLRHRLVEAGRLSPREAFDLLAPVMEALAFAHARGVVHRDLKPDNIFLAKTPTGLVPTLIDFGISKVAPRDEAQFRTKTGAILGTPWYMSPEQCLGKPVDGRTDLWSVGVVLYELLTGSTPFEHAEPGVALVHIVTQPTPRIERLAPDIPPALADAVHRALERDLAKRYPDVRAFLDALRACPLPDTALATSAAPAARTPTALLDPIEAPAAPAAPPVDALGPTDRPPPSVEPASPRPPTLPASAPWVGDASRAPTALMTPPPAPVYAPASPAIDRRRQVLGLALVAAALIAACVVSGALFAWSRRDQEAPDSHAGEEAPASLGPSPGTSAPAEPPTTEPASNGTTRPLNPTPRGHGRGHKRGPRGRHWD